MTKLRPYPQLVPSGYEWLGQIPEHWQTLRMKFGFDIQKRPVDPDMEIVTAFRDGQVTLRRNRRLDGFTEGDKQIGYQGIEPNDLVIHAMDAFAGAIGVSDSRGKSTPVYSVCSSKAGFEPRFFALVLRHLALTGFIESLAKGIRERSTDFRWSDAKNIVVPVPSLKEQQEILNFLDNETAEIDAFIRDQEELIELLKERRAAAITQAVTKGLDLSVPMKNSGIDWLGNTVIPAAWEARKLGHVARMRSGNSITAETIETEGSYPVYGGGGFRGYTESFTNEGHHVLIGRQGALCGNIKTASGKFFATEHAVVTYPRASTDITWFASILEVMSLGQYSQSAAQPGISVEVIAQKKMPLPPFEEQVRIGRFIDREAAEIDAAIADATEAIDLSKERRAALISAAVTGKIDVRNHISAELGAA